MRKNSGKRNDDDISCSLLECNVLWKTENYF